MMTKKRNTFQFDLNPQKKSATQIGYFSGYASVFNVMDEQGDRVLPGAFVHSLNNWQQVKSFPKMLWQHDPSEPIGKWLRMEEDHRGLYVEGQIILDLQKGREAYAWMKNGVIEGLSIGYHVVESQKGHTPGERLLSKVNLVEVSLVTFAANQAAKISAVKSEDHSLTPIGVRFLDSAPRGEQQDVTLNSFQGLTRSRNKFGMTALSKTHKLKQDGDKAMHKIQTLIDKIALI